MYKEKTPQNKLKQNDCNIFSLLRDYITCFLFVCLFYTCFLAVTRHYGYYVFINKEEINIKGLTSETPVYHEKDEQHPSVQNIIMFPGGIKGKQMFIYQNKSRPNSGNGEKKNNVLDICEVEIWGI